ncbi:MULTISPECIES: MlaD family protein [unclassified Mesorhizobium]|uniref:MlaD family protein n=1 Tax=unclassified Mesorhizobium TaxID=325217 RepID=UPI0003CEFAD2|nr:MULTISPECIES: MlaD family protein [unclassified Mesorhizobium]ESW94562.1 organic solvent ABC transporter substrate-binding protein [Mesorhizobium sp. LSJC265A00]ESX47419.1 organic solvent ABC transporter substrate-binding protein [Mesorhizobium sp. LSHC426A00]ESY15747.1 organic solvent ABC transporter substrate-binding protein [Mesorhizobium sp. LNJC394B00]ESY55509.1 organic solvent ABC transporter substrate-binding protein [Mesorhizobium sp. LNJC374B00]ESY56865.1 organic solvent ABC transp
METRANYVIVGIFTLAAILAAFGFVYWTAQIGDRGETAELRVRIQGSASGLGPGSLVLFNGVKVGVVKRVYFDRNDPNAAIATTEIDQTTPLTKSTQADIGIASLAGQVNIELKGADPKEPNLLEEAAKEGRTAEIVANPSAVTNLLQTAQNIFTRADKVLSELEGFTRDVRGPLTQTVKNAQTFSDALARNADGIDKFLTAVSALSDELKGVSGKLDGTLKAAESLLNAVDKDKIKSIVANVDAVTANLKETSEQLDGVIKNVDTAVGSVNDFATRTQGTLAKVDNVLDGIDPAQVRVALANIQKASENANKAAADIAKVTDKFADRADDIDETIKDAKQLASRLNDASVRVDGILKRVDTLLGSGQADGVMADARDTLKSFKQVADTLNARLGTITDNIARFSGQGLSNVEALVQDSRRSISRIEEAVTDLSRNPQRILSGGDGEVRQFDGRARR